MSDILRSAKYSLTHARRHMKSLDSELQTFFDEGPYRKVIQFDPSGPVDIHKVKLTKPLPEVLSGIAFDAVSNLRAALDQIGYAVATATGGKGEKANFPFGKTADLAASRAKKDSREIPSSIFDLMLKAQPYKDGNIFLWSLNQLCNCHKHRFIVPTAIYTGGATISNLNILTAREFTFPPKWNSDAQEMVIAVVPHGYPCTWNIQVETFVSFAEVEGLPVVPCSLVLENAERSVSDLIEVIEKECELLGLTL